MSEKLTEFIINYGKQVAHTGSIINLLRDDARELILSDGNAFLLGLLADQSVKAELAWSLPRKFQNSKI